MTHQPSQGLSKAANRAIIGAAAATALFLAVVLALLIAHLVRGPDQGGRSSASPAAPTNSGGEAPAPTGSGEPTAPTPDDSEAQQQLDANDSVCGLGGNVLKKAGLKSAPKVDRWAVQAQFMYPTSKEYGPGATAPVGYKYCYQHSPTGALYAAAYYTVMGGVPDIYYGGYTEYILAPGPYRDELVNVNGDEDDGGLRQGMRIVVLGFRILDYDGQKTTIDLAISFTIAGSTAKFSAATDLVWLDNDWKVSTEKPKGTETKKIADLSGYIPWGP